jgi:hypothetical protein
MSYTLHPWSKSPPLEANSSAASQEILHLLWHTKIHYRVHNRLPLVPIVTQIPPVHTFTPYFTRLTLVLSFENSQRFVLTLNLRSSFRVTDQVPQPYKTTGKILWHTNCIRFFPILGRKIGYTEQGFSRFYSSSYSKFLLHLKKI